MGMPMVRDKTLGMFVKEYLQRDMDTPLTVRTSPSLFLPHRDHTVADRFWSQHTNSKIPGPIPFYVTDLRLERIGYSRCFVQSVCTTKCLQSSIAGLSGRALRDQMTVTCVASRLDGDTTKGKWVELRKEYVGRLHSGYLYIFRMGVFPPANTSYGEQVRDETRGDHHDLVRGQALWVEQQHQQQMLRIVPFQDECQRRP